MIAYLIVTSLINMSLGYAMAVYVSRARLQAADAEPTPLHDLLNAEALTEPLAEQLAPTAPSTAEVSSAASADERRTNERTATWLAGDDAPSLTRIATPLEAADARPAAAAAVVEPALASDVPTMEKDLLAGIEEFRLQLAKIKGHAEGEPLAEALGVTLSAK